MRHEVTTHENPSVVHGVDFVYYGDQGNFKILQSKTDQLTNKY